MLQLLGIIVEYGKGVVRTAIEADPNYSPNTPPGTEMTRVEQGMTVYSSIHARLHESMKRQLGIQHRLNAMWLEESPHSNLSMEEAQKQRVAADDETSIPLAYKSDYEGEMDVQPVSDPNIFSEVQRISQTQSVLQLATQAPQLYDIRAIHKRMLQLMKVPGIEELMPDPPQPEDENPATENIKMAFGQPAFVLPHQDHLAHLQVLVDFMKDPFYGQNPAIKPKFIAMAVNHAVQHLLFLYGDEIKTLIEKAADKPIKELMSDDPQMKELMSKTVAAASPLALEQTEGLLKGMMPILLQAVKDMQAMQPPPPIDPAHAALQAKQVDASIKQNELQSREKLAQTEIAAKTQLDQEELKVNANESAAKTASAEKIEEMKSQTSIVTTAQDNKTALEIASMRAITGGSTGGIKDGKDLGHTT